MSRSGRLLVVLLSLALLLGSVTGSHASATGTQNGPRPFAVPGFATFVNINCNAATSCTTASIAVSAGDSIAFLVNPHTNTPGTLTPTDGAGDTWTTTASCSNVGGTSDNLYAFTVLSATGSAGETFKISATATDQFDTIAIVLSSGTAWDGSNCGSVGASPGGVAVTTTTGNDIVAARYECETSSDTFGASSDTSIASQVSPAAGGGWMAVYETFTTAAADTAKVTSSSCSGAVLGIAIALTGGTPTAGAITPASPTIDSGQSVTLTSNASGGTGSFSTYAWYAGSSSTCASDTLVSGATSSTYAPSPTSATYYCYTVTDTAGNSATSATDHVSVDSALAAGAITPAAPTIDNGGSVGLTANPSGGTGSYSYAWYSGSSSTCSSDTLVGGDTLQVETFSPTSNEYYCYHVTDTSTDPPTVASATDLVAVDSALSPGSLSPASPTIDSGQSVTLTASPTGGDPPYSYAWVGGTSSTCTSDTTISGQTASTLTRNPTSNTYYCARIVDSSVQSGSNGNGYTSSDLVTVSSALSNGAPTPSNPTIDLGQSVTITAHPSGGTTPYTYAWYAGSSSTCSSDALVPGQTSSTYSPSPSATEYVCVGVSDSSTNPPTLLSATDLITVDPALSVSVTPGAPSIDLGQSLTLTANPTGGDTPYTAYLWYSGSSSTCASDTSTGVTTSTYLVSPTASTYYCVTVTDSVPNTVSSATDLVTVNPALSAGAVSPTSPTIDLGQSITFIANPSGGTSPDSYQWYAGSSATCSSDTLVPGATSGTYAPSPTAAEYVCVVVSDSAYAPVTASSATDSVSVNTALLAGTVTPTGTILDSGQTVLLTANPSGGTVPYSFQWYSGSSSSCSSDSPIGGATSGTYPAHPGATTRYCVAVTDSAYSPVRVSSATDLVTVNPRLVAGLITPSGPIVNIGQSVTLVANPIGGTLSYSYAWVSGGSTNCSSDAPVAGASSSNLTVTPIGDVYYCYTVTDSATVPTNATSGADGIIVITSSGGGGGGGPSFALMPGTAILSAVNSFVVPVFTVQHPSGDAATVAQTTQILKGLTVTLIGAGNGAFRNWSVYSWTGGLFNLTIVFTVGELSEIDAGASEVTLNGTGVIQGVAAPASGVLNESVFKLAGGTGQWWSIYFGITTPPPFANPTSLGEIMQDLAWWGDSTAGKAIYAVAGLVLVYTWLLEAHRRTKRRIAAQDERDRSGGSPS